MQMGEIRQQALLFLRPYITYILYFDLLIDQVRHLARIHEREQKQVQMLLTLTRGAPGPIH